MGQRMLVVFVETSRQGQSLAVSISCGPRPFCVPARYLVLARLFPLCPRPAGASRLDGRIALPRGSRWLTPSSGLGLSLGTVERGGHMGNGERS